MSGFSPDWLALREPYDHAARDAGLAAGLGAWLKMRDAVAVMDLGCGTGSNLRYLAPRLPGPQRWWLVDHDETLLATLVAGPEYDPRCHCSTRHDLRDLAGLPFERTDAVVASALTDLVSETWFRGLAMRCRAAGAAVLLALSYDGRMVWDPELPDDSWIETRFNAHQRSARVFGPAMGPDAVGRMPAILRELGYRVSVAETPWQFAPGDVRIQAELLDGIVAACLELAPDEADRTTNWSNLRGQLIADGRSRLSVGHGDILAVPAESGE